jgi:SAM-dependent methyltransferase
MLSQINEILKKPNIAFKFVIRKIKEKLLWNYYYTDLREPKTISNIPHESKIQKEIIGKLINKNFSIINFEIDVNDYRKYINNAEYSKFPCYYGGGKGRNFIEKSLEHYLAAKFLDLNKDDIYIDIASSDSPAPEIYPKIYGCKAYRQDLDFPEGIQGNIIGGDAGEMPVDDGFASKMGLHCSFEHFELDSDIRFIKEASRVLKKGGKLCILPLYFFNKYSVQTDPSVLPGGGISFENDAILYCARGSGTRHSRFYDVPHFVTRIRNNLNGLKLTIYVVKNEKKVDPSCYVKFIGLFEKE